MKPRNLEELLQVLKAMGQFEIAMSVLYKICAKKWEEDSDFWLSLSKEEIKHSENAKRLGNIIHERLGSNANFQFNRPFTLNSVQSFYYSIMDTIENVRQDNIPKKKMLAIALDIECSALERRYSELVKTDDIEYQTISKTIDDETKIHREKIEKKLKEYKVEINH